MRRRWLLTIGTVLLLTACGGGRTKQYNPLQVDFSATYNPMFEGQLYPSLIMGMANLEESYNGASSVGEPSDNALFSVSVTSPANNAILRITVDSSNLNYVTIIQEELPRRGQRYTFYPTLRWKYDKLYRTRQQGAIDLSFTCYINDEEVDVKNMHLHYRSVNDCLLSIRDTAGVHHDYRWMFAAYVNEEHPYTDTILSGMLQQGVVNKIMGYQSTSQHVVNQVEAIWHYALQHGITYSSISCTANPTKRSNVQRIRFFDEVYNTRQANCIDACVFFASVMRHIGLKPVIFVEPCHAYLGYYTDKNRRKMRLLETTITGWVDFNALERSLDPEAHGVDRLPAAQYAKVSKYLTEAERKRWEEDRMTFDELKHAVAHNLFVRASEYDNDNYKANRELFNSPENMQYQRLDIEQLRSQVKPITGE